MSSTSPSGVRTVTTLRSASRPVTSWRVRTSEVEGGPQGRRGLHEQRARVGGSRRRRSRAARSWRTRRARRVRGRRSRRLRRGVARVPRSSCRPPRRPQSRSLVTPCVRLYPRGYIDASVRARRGPGSYFPVAPERADGSNGTTPLLLQLLRRLPGVSTHTSRCLKRHTCGVPRTAWTPTSLCHMGTSL